MSQSVVSFIEFGAGDPQAAGPFLAKLLGWKFHPMGKGGWFDTPMGRAGMHGDDPGQLYAYFAVADLEAAMAQVRELGGTAAAQGPGDSGFGRFADCTGPGGVKFGLHQRPR
ncbi:MAG: hypothetical protein IT548_14780 [Alphaproteobacteria bacterium]|nr:hypothetical protein [Alphaproteobacteria bacterium]